MSSNKFLLMYTGPYYSDPNNTSASVFTDNEVQAAVNTNATDFVLLTAHPMNYC